MKLLAGQTLIFMRDNGKLVCDVYFKGVMPLGTVENIPQNITVPDGTLKRFAENLAQDHNLKAKVSDNTPYAFKLS